MGLVYRAAHVRIATTFAVKVLFGELAYDPETRVRFRREAEAASCLSSRHIVRVLDFGESDEGASYLVMEYLEGASLSAALARAGRFEEAEAVRIGRQIARGLAHAHDRGVVHRDLKPDKVFLAAEDGGAPGRAQRADRRGDPRRGAALQRGRRRRLRADLR